MESKIKAFHEGHEEWKRMKEHLRQQKLQSKKFLERQKEQLQQQKRYMQQQIRQQKQVLLEQKERLEE